MSAKTAIVFLIFCLSLYPRSTAYCQEPDLTMLVKKLSSKADFSNENFYSTYKDLLNKDSIYVYHTIEKLEKYLPVNPYFNARFYMLRLSMDHKFRFNESKGLFAERARLAIKESHKSSDLYHIFLTTYFVGSYAYVYPELELAATLLLEAEAINKQIKVKSKHQKDIWLLLGEVLFHTREYENSITYLKKGLAAMDKNRKTVFFYIKDLNTIGQAYQQLHQFDSALSYYNQSLNAESNLIGYENKVWQAINYGFIGQVQFEKGDLEKAKSFLERDYNYNKDHAKNVAGYSLQWLAKIYLQKNDRPAALNAVKEALHLLESSGDYTIQRSHYLQQVYRTTADVYRAYNNTDSLYHYSNLYLNLHDSLEKLAFETSTDILVTRLENEKNYQQIASLGEEKKAAIQKRNFIILWIALTAVIGLLYLNKLRAKHQHKEQLVLQEKRAGELLAQEQLASVKQNLIDKVEIIERLQQQLNYHQNSVEKQELSSAIASLTILTDDDWEKFKSHFEKMHPGFFINLQEKVKDITTAELRMAALTRLHLSTHQIASILGISANSVYKTRQRLRQRLNLEPETSIEEKILNI